MFGAPSNVHEVAPEDMLIPPHFATICEGLCMPNANANRSARPS